MSSGFYRAFEDKYRGSRELVRSRLDVYRPFVEAVKALYPDASCIDLGCGRGEWLELVKEMGLSARGVDLDDGMLEACEGRGLCVEKGDAVQLLKGLPSESQAIISGFHIAEHLPFDVLQELVEQSFRVLKPCGLLILETPNPENIVVGTADFYMDPTHFRPIPPKLLSFLSEYYGFARTKILRLQESKEFSENGKLSLSDVFLGVSPDYSVVSQKAIPMEREVLFNEAFKRDYGVSLHKLSACYDEKIMARLLKAESMAQKAESMAQKAEAALNSVYSSRSWRITAPLRWWGLQFRRIRAQGFKARAKALAKKVGMPIIFLVHEFVNTRPRLRKRVLLLALKVGVFDKLKGLYRQLERQRADTFSVVKKNIPEPVRQLSPHARKIHARLEVSIKGLEGKL